MATATRIHVVLEHSLRQVFLVILLFSSSPSFAQTTTTITSSGLNTTVTPPAPGGTVYSITNGTPAGSNLFHSFGEFTIGALNTARFQTGLVNPVADATVSNILGRVTGGNPSSIFGTVDSATFYPSANLFLMNPAGIVFGPTATLNVGGSVAFTTANYLRLAEADGSNVEIFHANPAETSKLTTAPVAAFGFLSLAPGTMRGTISVQGSAFSVPNGQSITLVGGDVVIGSGAIGETSQTANVSAPNGQIRLASTNSPGEFLLTDLSSAPNIDGASFTSYGTAKLAAGSTIDVAGTNTVSIRGGEFVLKVTDAVLTTAESAGTPETISLARGSSIVTANVGTNPGADVEVATGTLQLDGATIKSTTTGDGRGGYLFITAQTTDLTNGAQIVAGTESIGAGGNITLSAQAPSAPSTLSISGFDSDGTSGGIQNPDGFITSGVFTTASSGGPGGEASIHASSVILDQGGVIETRTSGGGRGGNISVSANTVDITGGGGIISRSGDLSGSGQGGDIAVRAVESVVISGVSLDVFTLSNVSSTTGGNAFGGNILVSAPTVSLDSGGTIASSTGGTKPGGRIAVTADNEISITGFSAEFGTLTSILSLSSDFAGGEGGSIDISAPLVRVNQMGTIQTTTGVGSAGRAGDITIADAQQVEITNGGLIRSQSGSSAATGRVTIRDTDTVMVSGLFDDPDLGFNRTSMISNESVGPGGNGGLDIRATKLILTDGGQLLSRTEQNLQGGTINIVADEFVSLSSGGQIVNTRGSLVTGSVKITAPSITLDQGLIRSRTFGSHNAGAMTISATDGSVTLSNASQILTATAQGASGNAGPIQISASDSVLLTGGSTISSSSILAASGDGGPISLVAQNLVSVTGSGTAVLSETTGSGNGGPITVQAPQVQITGGAVISAKSTGSGASGSVTIQGNSPAQSIRIEGAGGGIFTDTQGTGAGGDIFVNANSVTLRNGGTLSAKTSGTQPTATGGTITVDATNTVSMTSGASITASSTGPGNAGNISINAGNQLMLQNSSITTQASQASGGKINIRAVDLVRLVNSTISTSVLDGAGGGGDIFIDPNSVILQNSQILAQAIQGNGGNITITTPLFLADSSSRVSASSQFGLNGTVTIQSPTSNLSESLGTLTSKPSQVQNLLTQRCAALANGQASSFVVAGREQLPADPGGWLTSPLAFAALNESLDTADAVASMPTVVAMAAQDSGMVSLRRLTPAGFLIANFADSEATGCHS